MRLPPCSGWAAEVCAEAVQPSPDGCRAASILRLPACPGSELSGPAAVNAGQSGHNTGPGTHQSRRW